ncbi:MAG: RIO1 family regulatory kinase/ATPase [Actinomycetota bacterium]
MRTIPDGLVLDPVDEHDLGVLRSGKEAQINVVEWTDGDGHRCLVARKLYLPREVKAKGTLEALGAQRSTAFRNDAAYREGRQFRKTRDRRAVERMTTYGKRLLQDRWTSHEHDVMRRLWDEGAPVPYPIRYGADVFHLEYVGDAEQAAPQLAQARLDDDDLAIAWEQVVDGLHAITRAGYAHGDLSAYNVLWWDGQVWFIDFPQAVDLAANPNGFEFLHRDVLNVTTWFNRRGLDEDAEEVFAEVLSSAW